MKSTRLSSIAAIAAVGCAVITPAQAQSLRDTFLSAYGFNPRIEAERARLRAEDEGVARANSGYRPTVSANTEIGTLRSNTDPRSLADGRTNPYGVGVTLSQPVFSGFRTVHGVREAEASVYAGRESLRSVEQSVLLDAIIAHADVVRDGSVVRLREKNLSWLVRELSAARERLAVKEATRTDVAQTETRRAAAISALDEARAQLKASRASYFKVVGQEARKLGEPGESRHLPRTLEDALAQAASNNPNIGASRFRADAARHTVEKTTGELLPTFQVDASYLRRFDGSPIVDRQEVGTVTGRLNVPLYAAGETDARIRQTKHQHFARVQEVQQTSLEVDAAVKTAWSRLLTTRAQLLADRAQVKFARDAVKGVREEFAAGQRTSIEVLNAEQEAVNAEIQLELTRRNVVVSGYALLSAMGRMSLYDVVHEHSTYDPAANLAQVRRKWSGVVVTPDVDRTRADGWETHTHRAPAGR